MTSYQEYLVETGRWIQYVLGITTPVSDVHAEANGKVRYTTTIDGEQVSKVIHMEDEGTP